MAFRQVGMDGSGIRSGNLGMEGERRGGKAGGKIPEMGIGG